MAMEFNFILPENFEEQSVSHLLEKTWLIPRKQRYLIRSKKHFFINGTPGNDFDKVVKSDHITIIFDENDFTALAVKLGDPSKAVILYEDEHLVIVNKPEGMKTHGNTPDELALQNHVAAAIHQPVFVVHRLDEATSGAVLFAKNQFVLPILGRMFEKNEIHREYLALVKGNFSQKNMTLNLPLGRDRHDKRKQVVSKTGKVAITHVNVLSSFSKTSLVSCRLDTGRTHQIRVHLAYLSHPIIGDSLYGHSKNETRLMLHAYKLILRHPFSNEKIEAKASSQTFKNRYEHEKSLDFNQ